jgi:hypothetical protein
LAPLHLASSWNLESFYFEINQAWLRSPWSSPIRSLESGVATCLSAPPLSGMMSMFIMSILTTLYIHSYLVCMFAYTLTRWVVYLRSYLHYIIASDHSIASNANTTSIIMVFWEWGATEMAYFLESWQKQDGWIRSSREPR